MNERHINNQSLDINTLIPFSNHPFKVLFDESLLRLTESIRLHGLQAPIIVRKYNNDGLYEILSGHRRVEAVKLLGYKTIDGQIVDYNDHDAVIYMIQSNNYREKILPSEKGYSYRMLLEAYKAKGKTGDESDLVFKGRSNEKLASIVKESVTQIKRYIRLTYLISDLIELVDNNTIALRPAVEFSYLSEEHQKWLYEFICTYESSPTYSQAVNLKKLEKEGLFTSEILLNVFETPKANQKEKISVNYDTISPYIPREIMPRQVEMYIIAALKYYNDYCNNSETSVL